MSTFDRVDCVVIGAGVIGIETYGVPGVVNLYGIESPGLTAALAIAEAIARDL